MMDKIRKVVSKVTIFRRKQTTKSWVLRPPRLRTCFVSEPVPKIFAHGLFILHPPPELPAEQEQIYVE